MQAKFGKFIAIACAAAVLSGYQLLPKNSDKGNAAVVLSTTAGLDVMRVAGSRSDAVERIFNGLSATIVDEVEARATKVILAADPSIAVAASKPTTLPQKGIQPIKGSESILFGNLGNHQLGDCSRLGLIELHHTGSLEDALIMLRNESYKMNSNLLLPIKANSTTYDYAGPNEISIEAHMMQCPIKLASGN